MIIEDKSSVPWGAVWKSAKLSVKENIELYKPAHIYLSSCWDEMGNYEVLTIRLDNRLSLHFAVKPIDIDEANTER